MRVIFPRYKRPNLIA